MSSKPRSIFPVTDAEGEERLYFGMIDETSARSEQHKYVSNGKPAHAIYLLYKFFSEATRSVKICTSSLARSLRTEEDHVWAYGDPHLIKTVVRFLEEPEANLQILIAKKPDAPDGLPNHPLVKAVHAAGLVNSMRIHQGNEEQVSRFPYDFIVMDGQAVRVEVDPNEAKAYACFGKNELAENLSRQFDFLVNGGQQLYPPSPA